MMTVSQAVKTYLALRLNEGIAEDGDTIRHLDLHLARRFCADFGGRMLDTIEPADMRAWDKSLTNPKTGSPMSLVTRRHHLIDVKTFFKRAHLERWISFDPSRVVRLPDLPGETPNVIPVRDAFTFFQRNRDHRSTARVALEAFAGLRYTSAGKLEKADVNFEERGIEMPANKHKSGKRKYRQGHPINLWEWLKHAGEDCWRLSLRVYAADKPEMMAVAGLRPYRLKTEEERATARILKNVWRHSFASYLLARTKSFETVGYLMQHSRPSTTEIYEGMARERDAMLYFAITPRTVLMSWDEFVAQTVAAHAPPLVASVVSVSAPVVNGWQNVQPRPQLVAAGEDRSWLAE